MTLRQKSLITIAITLMSLLAVLYITSSRILMASFAHMEEQSTEESVARVRSTISDTIAKINSTATDWSAWDDTYNFIQNGNKKYVEDNFLDDSIKVLNINV